MTLNKLALRKTIFLLIGIVLMVTCIGSAAASASDSQPSYSTSASQIQAGQISVYQDSAYIGLGAAQSAESSTTGVGAVEISQSQDLNSKILTNNAGEVKSITGKITQNQAVDTASGPSSATKINNNYVNTYTTDISPNINFIQWQKTDQSTGDITQSQSAFVKVIEQNGKYHVIEHYKQKQS